VNERITYPFVAITGQERMKLALILNIINPSISGVLIRGEKGTAKSTAVRGLAELLPMLEVIRGCPFQLAPTEQGEVCAACGRQECRDHLSRGEPPEVIERRTVVAELPIGATEDRVVGTLDLEYALQHGAKRFEPGLLASAHRGILYVDEVNLLDDHVVDVLLDSAAMSVNTVEREGISYSHPARFTLVGTMNPEEGELRPQLLDRFGLCVTVEGARDAVQRVEIIERRSSFEQDPAAFASRWENESQRIAEAIARAIEIYPSVTADRELLFEIANYCIQVGVDGHRGDIVMLKTAKTLAAYYGRQEVRREDIEEAATLALPHRVRRQPMQDIASDVELRRAVTEGASRQ
jgi:magnesium chelatase subunit I